MVPSVLAMLGDNPMQSEIACHVGLAGKFFCRVCQVSRSTSEDPEELAVLGLPPPLPLYPHGPHPGHNPFHWNPYHGPSGPTDSDAASVASSQSSQHSQGSQGSSGPGNGQQKKSRKKNAPETMAQMVDRVRRFMSVCINSLMDSRRAHAHSLGQIGPLRSRMTSIPELRSQFLNAQRVGGQSSVLRSRTESGVKDTYQGHFLSRLFSYTTPRGRSVADKLADVARCMTTIPRVDEYAASPVWRIHGMFPVPGGIADILSASETLTHMQIHRSRSCT